MVGIRWKLLNALGSDFDETLSDIGKHRNNLESDRNLNTPILSDIRRLTVGFLFQRFRRNFLGPIGSY